MSLERIIDPVRALPVMRAALSYDPETGEIRWRERPDQTKTWNIRYPGTLAFNSKKGNGVRYCGRWGGQLYDAAALAWFLHTGEWPWADRKIVHFKDGDASNLRFKNLYLSDKKVGDNERPLPKGISYHVVHKAYLVRVMVAGKRKQIGSSKSLDEALSILDDWHKEQRKQQEIRSGRGPDFVSTGGVGYQRTSNARS